MAHRQPTAMMGMPHPSKTNETKPRLGKDEVDILEREFKKNPKPSTQTKRQFAEDMRVDLARINNWFQNRRAKRKQELKQEAHEAGQAREALGFSENQPDSNNSGGNYFDTASYLEDSHILPMQQPSVPYPLVSTGPPPAVAPYNPQYADSRAATYESFQRTVAAAEAASKQQEYHESFAEQETHPGFHDPSLHTSGLDGRAHFPAVSPYDSGQYEYASFPNEIYNTSAPPFSECQSSPTTNAPAHFDAYTPTSAETEVHGPQPVSAFPSQLLTAQSHDSLPLRESETSKTPEESTTSTLAIGFNYDVAESEEKSRSPPAPSMPFKSPPPTDIASRRKKVHVKPAALTADTMRRRPSACPRTVSHADGFRLPADSPLTSPMRRIVSAGGSRGIMSGRINKGGAESAQRSPINLGGFADAGSFIERNYHNLRHHPSMTQMSSLNSNLAPPTPMSPHGGEMTLGKREGSWSTASPVDGGMNFIFNARVPGCFTTAEGDQNLASPPETPQDHLGLGLLGNGWPGGVDMHDEQWQFDVADEPLYTPAQDSFGIDLQMPQPSYISSLSQPVTPAFSNFNPNFTIGHESPQQKLDSPQCSLSNNSEYSFADGPYTAGLSTSPTSKQKAFQFSNATAADFSEK